MVQRCGILKTFASFFAKKSHQKINFLLSNIQYIKSQRLAEFIKYLGLKQKYVAIETGVSRPDIRCIKRNT